MISFQRHTSLRTGLTSRSFLCLSPWTMFHCWGNIPFSNPIIVPDSIKKFHISEIINSNCTIQFEFFRNCSCIVLCKICSWIKIGDPFFKIKYLLVQNEKQVKQASAMSLQVCPAMSLSSGDGDQKVESACHVPDARSDHRCFSDEECGVDAINCRRRSCSIAGYCGLWLLLWYIYKQALFLVIQQIDLKRKKESWYKNVRMQRRPCLSGVWSNTSSVRLNTRKKQVEEF